MHDAGRVRVVLIERKCNRKLLCNQRRRQVVIPDQLHRRQTQRFAQVRSHRYR